MDLHRKSLLVPLVTLLLASACRKAPPIRAAAETPVEVSTSRWVSPGVTPAELVDRPSLRGPWSEAMGADPLVAAASGVAFGGVVLVAAAGRLWTIEPRRGDVLAVVDLPDASRERGASWASARAGTRAWFHGPMVGPDVPGADSPGRPHGLWSVALAAPAGAPLHPARAELVVAEQRALLTGGAGGAMISGACEDWKTAGGDGAGCVLQPGGGWRQIGAPEIGDPDLATRGAAPLANGGLVFVRGLPGSDDLPHPGSRGAGAAPLEPYFVVRDPKGAERPFGPPFLVGTDARGIRVVGRIDETPGPTVHVILRRGDELFAVAQAGGNAASAPVPIPGVIHGELRGGRGVAFGFGRVLVSLDAGARWAEVPVPADLKAHHAHVAELRPEATPEEADRLRSWLLDALGPIRIDDAGFAVGAFHHLGWGPRPR
jgi:hypothetical protein